MMTSTFAPTTITKIATSLGIEEDDLFRQALVSFLREKKRQLLQIRLGILARYSAKSAADLEAKIAQGIVAEHPAWEDLIVVENLTARLEELDAYLRDLQNPESHRLE
ncbi:MAG: hypothetical protein D6759_15540 [Chloroflexi bacterium]|nr:MAG: hypothetical protein D6759_15540 [Chloroflexota bacterium]